MIAFECQQGSAEWYQARCGAITGSMFSAVRKLVGGLTTQQAQYVDLIRSGHDQAAALTAAGYKKAPAGDKITRALAGERVGDYSSAAHDYAFALAIERQTGNTLADEKFETYAMRRGHELEPEARRLHGLDIMEPVTPTGFVATDDGKFGASADGLIGEVGGAEYKCYVDPTKLRAILVSQDLSDVMDQCQGGMWITGRKWWDFCLYCPALEPLDKDLTRFRIQRDEAYIDSLEADLWAFDGLVEQYRITLSKAAA